jgi:hypothetical protein
MTPAERLRAFEDEKLGAAAPRHNGQVEKGHGSFFATKLTDADRAHHAALEHLVHVDQKVAHARAALAAAEDELAEAERRCDVDPEPPVDEEPPTDEPPVDAPDDEPLPPFREQQPRD